MIVRTAPVLGDTRAPVYGHRITDDDGRDVAMIYNVHTNRLYGTERRQVLSGERLALLHAIQRDGIDAAVLLRESPLFASYGWRVIHTGA